MLKRANSRSTSSLSISVAQNPKIARMCGILETNTLRLIDPPLVLVLEVRGEYTRQQLDAIGKSFVCQLNLFEAESRQNADYIVEMFDQQVEESVKSIHTGLPPKKLHNLVGSTASNAVLLKISHEYDAKRKLFFAFPHLSVRLPGRYYLSCVVSRVG